MPTVNLEMMVELMLPQARKDGTVDRWIEYAVEFMRRQDTALGDAREGMRQYMDIVARQRAMLIKLNTAIGAGAVPEELAKLIEAYVATPDAIPGRSAIIVESGGSRA